MEDDDSAAESNSDAAGGDVAEGAARPAVGEDTGTHPNYENGVVRRSRRAACRTVNLTDSVTERCRLCSVMMIREMGETLMKRCMNHDEKRCAAEADLTMDFDAPSKADTARAFWDRRERSVSVRSPKLPHRRIGW